MLRKKSNVVLNVSIVLVLYRQCEFCFSQSIYLWHCILHNASNEARGECCLSVRTSNILGFVLVWSVSCCKNSNYRYTMKLCNTDRAHVKPVTITQFPRSARELPGPGLVGEGPAPREGLGGATHQ